MIKFGPFGDIYSLFTNKLSPFLRCTSSNIHILTSTEPTDDNRIK